MEITKTWESQINYETQKYSGLHPRICAFIFSFNLLCLLVSIIKWVMTSNPDAITDLENMKWLT